MEEILHDLGSKYSSMNGIWALKLYYLGPWTLRVLYHFGCRKRSAAIHSAASGALFTTAEGLELGPR